MKPVCSARCLNWTLQKGVDRKIPRILWYCDHISFITEEVIMVINGYGGLEFLGIVLGRMESRNQTNRTANSPSTSKGICCDRKQREGKNGFMMQGNIK